MQLIDILKTGKCSLPVFLYCINPEILNNSQIGITNSNFQRNQNLSFQIELVLFLQNGKRKTSLR